MGFQVLKAKIGVVSATKSTFSATISDFGISGPSSIFWFAFRSPIRTVRHVVRFASRFNRARANRFEQVLRPEEDFSMMLSGFHDAVRLSRLAQRKNRMGHAAK
jgi:hypothetical protein